MNNFIVYKYTNQINEKVYIGVTCQGLQERAGKNGRRYKKDNCYFGNAITKYGWVNFKPEILFSGLTKEEAFIKERECILNFQSNNSEKGYNLTAGGEGALDLAPNSLQKIKFKNTKFSVVAHHPKLKGYIYFESANSAAKQLNMEKSSGCHIREVIQGKRQNCLSLDWSFVDKHTQQDYLSLNEFLILNRMSKDEFLDFLKKDQNNKKSQRKKHFIKTEFLFNDKLYILFFERVSDCARFFKINVDSIYSCLNGHRRSVFTIDFSESSSEDFNNAAIENEKTFKELTDVTTNAINDNILIYLKNKGREARHNEIDNTRISK